jgi:predicted HNH restriction endonuclease
MSELKQGSYEWFKALSQKDYEALLTHVRLKVKEVCTSEHFTDEEAVEAAQDNFDYFLDELGDIEWNQKFYTRMVYTALFKNIIPKIDFVARTYQANWLTNSWIIIRLYYSGKAFSRKFNKAQGKEVKARGSYVLDSLKLAITPSTVDMKSLFPQVDPILNRIEIRQKHAQKLELSIEEQYFFDNVRDQLLPAIFTAADRIKNSPSIVRDEAIDNFVQQLGLIEKRMSDMIAHAEQRTLADVRNQTAFLVESMERKQIAS